MAAITRVTTGLIRRIGAAVDVLLGRAIAYDKRKVAHHNLMFSQEGEDGILRRLLEHQKSGFYIDVGAHHPQRFSNTYFFYLRGWHGINIEPNPGSIAEFQRIRPRDLNLELGVANQEGLLVYHQYEETALNTFDSKTANQLQKTLNSRSCKVRVQPLRMILHQHLKANQEIDFMSIDVEGMDEEVVRSNNWKNFRPRFLLVESRRTSTIIDVQGTPLHHFLESQSYSLISKCMNTLIYKSEIQP